MARPLPLHCWRVGGASIGAGTGFLVGRGPRRWLVTCAHVVTGLKNTPAHMLDLFRTELLIVGSGQTIPLFDSKGPRFAAANDPSDGMLYDAIAIPLKEVEAFALARFGSYDGTAFVEPSLGMTVTIEGFPGMELEVIPLVRNSGTVTQVHGASVALSVPGKEGFSGGPATSADGLVGVLYGDIGTSPNRTSALIHSFTILGPVLFR